MLDVLCFSISLFIMMVVLTIVPSFLFAYLGYGCFGFFCGTVVFKFVRKVCEL